MWLLVLTNPIWHRYRQTHSNAYLTIMAILIDPIEIFPLHMEKADLKFIFLQKYYMFYIKPFEQVVQFPNSFFHYKWQKIEKVGINYAISAHF